MATPKYRDTETEKIHLNYAYGGQSVDFKLAIPNSFYSSQAMDVRSIPSQMSVLPGMSDISGGVVTDLIGAMDQDLDGVRWAVGNKGNVYKIDTDDVISNTFTLPEDGSCGLYYDSITDQLYIPGQSEVSLYGRVTTSDSTDPTYRPGNFGKSASNDPGCVNLFNSGDGFFDGINRNDINNLAVGVSDPNDVTISNATGTFTVATVLSEDTGQFCPFAPDIEPFYSIAVYVAKVGTGNWTLTLHDSLNNSLVSVTILNANMVAGWNEFVFGKQVRALVQQAQTGSSALYHFHLISSVGDGEAAVVPEFGSDGVTPMGTGATGKLDSVAFLLFAYRLVETNNTWHPTAYFNGDLCIGNERYLSIYDFSNDSAPTNQQWIRHALIFKSGYEVCGLSTNNQYLVIALERRSNDATRNFQDGQLVFWDTTTQNPNFIIDVPMGAPYGLQTFNNVTYFICAGSLFAWSGGQTVIKVRKLAYQNTNFLGTVDSTIVNPNAMTIRYNLLEIAYPSSTTNVGLNYGVYSWGSVEVMYPNSLTYDYALSNGQINTSPSTLLQIGCAYNFVDSMYTSWQYTDSNGVVRTGLDLLDNSSTPAPSGNFRSLIYDGGVSYKTKNAQRMQLTFLPLPAGYSLQAFYSLDRGADVLSPPALTGGQKLVFEIDFGRARELQWGYYWTQTGATKPLVLTGVTMEIDTLTDEVGMSPTPVGL